MPESARALLGPAWPGAVRWALGKLLELGMRVTRQRRYDDYRLERVCGVTLLVLPGVANPRLLRTGAYFAEQLDDAVIDGRSVLDMGTGSGVCALVCARRASRVVAVDISRAAVRCARMNALMNQLDGRVDVRHGDLFATLGTERFDLVLFNPPFLVGAPVDERDAAWRSSDAAARFARGLDAHLTEEGGALLLLSSFGNACERYIDALRAEDFSLAVFARRRFINETLTILRVTRRAGA